MFHPATFPDFSPNHCGKPPATRRPLLCLPVMASVTAQLTPNPHAYKFTIEGHTFDSPTSVGSAAYNDFVDEISGSDCAFRILACDARVQGAETEKTVVAAIACITVRDLTVRRMSGLLPM